MSTLVDNYLSPLKELDTSNSISRVSDDFDSKIEYAESISEVSGLQDELTVLTAAKEAYAKLLQLPKSELRTLAMEMMGVDLDVKITAINNRLSTLS